MGNPGEAQTVERKPYDFPLTDPGENSSESGKNRNGRELHCTNLVTRLASLIHLVPSRFSSSLFIVSSRLLMAEALLQPRSFLIADKAGSSFAAIYLASGFLGEEGVRSFILSAQRVASPDHATLIEFDPQEGWSVLAGGLIEELRSEADVLVLAPLPPSPARGA